jgi:hypothetical protein
MELLDAALQKEATTPREYEALSEYVARG